MISFHYNQENTTQYNTFNTISSYHIINSAKILKFTYRNVQPLHKYEPIVTYPSASYDFSAMPISSRPQQSIKSSKGINLVTSKRTKGKVNKNALPKSLSTELQDESASNSKQRKMSQSNHEQKVGNPNINPQSIYTYILPNHISLQSNNKTNCEIFSICKEPNEQQHNESRETNVKTGKTTTIDQQVKEKEQKSAARQKIFELQKISQFNIQDATQIKEAQMIRIQEKNMLDRIKENSKPPSYTSFNRKRLFSEIILPKQKNYTILEQQVDIDDIPQVIIQQWQKFGHQINEWSPSVQSKQVTSNYSSTFQNI